MAVTWAGIVLGLGFVLSFGYWTTDFLMVQRAFSAKDLRAARMTPIIASFLKMAVPFLVIMAGLVALVLANLHPDLWWGIFMLIFGLSFAIFNRRKLS